MTYFRNISWLPRRSIIPARLASAVLAAACASARPATVPSVQAMDDLPTGVQGLRLAPVEARYARAPGALGEVKLYVSAVLISSRWGAATDARAALVFEAVREGIGSILGENRQLTLDMDGDGIQGFLARVNTRGPVTVARTTD